MSYIWVKRRKPVELPSVSVGLELAEKYGGRVINTESPKGSTPKGFTSQGLIDAKAPGSMKLKRRKRRAWVSAGKCVSIPVSEYNPNKG